MLATVRPQHQPSGSRWLHERPQAMRPLSVRCNNVAEYTSTKSPNVDNTLLAVCKGPRDPVSWGRGVRRTGYLGVVHPPVARARGMALRSNHAACQRYHAGIGEDELWSTRPMLGFINFLRARQDNIAATIWREQSSLSSWARDVACLAPTLSLQDA